MQLRIFHETHFVVERLLILVIKENDGNLSIKNAHSFQKSTLKNAKIKLLLEQMQNTSTSLNFTDDELL